jgi:predicted homoserine dehydrogenase-like protein
MLKTLQKRARENNPITVGLVGIGAMGMGIAHQINLTPGMKLVWVADKILEKAEKAASITAGCIAGSNANELLKNLPVDVFVESTNSIQSALEYCETAILNKSHVVLMNAEVDLAFGPYLSKLASDHGVVVTSDAGDQHGVLASMIEEITIWGFDIVQAGNIKGFLNREATIESLAHEASLRNLDPSQCCAYTDGTKLNIEMAIIANAYGYLPLQDGMTGPRAKNVAETLSIFDFNTHPKEGVIDYILGAEPGGGVYVIAQCDHPLQVPYLHYYKLLKSEQGSFYLFYRPYHLCHLETPKAIFKAVEYHEAILQPWKGRVVEVYAYAKSDFPAGTVIDEAIGSNIVYGLVKTIQPASSLVPIVTLENETQKPVLNKDVVKGQALHFEDIDWPATALLDKYNHPSNLPST